MSAEEIGKQNSTSIGGGWLGIYQFRSVYAMITPVRFEATFHASAAGFTGQILDEAFPGLADVEGRQTGSHIEFTKTYIQAPSAERSRVTEYRGQLSDDGRSMEGTWHIKIPKSKISLFGIHGTWSARRTWNEDEAENVREESQSLTAVATQELAAS